MSIGTPVYPSAAPSTRNTHHWTLGPLPRILLILATIVGIGGSIWTSSVASPDIGFNPGPLLVVYVAGVFLAWAAKPREENRKRIVSIWVTVIGYVGIIVGGAMIGIVDGTAPNLSRLQNGWGDPWYGIGEMIGIASFFLFLVAGIVTSVVYARGEDE